MKKIYHKVRVVFDPEKNDYRIEGKASLLTPWRQIRYLNGIHFSREQVMSIADTLLREQVIYEIS